MQMRALAIGALMGFVIALSPSCSEAKKCGPQNCNGCCDTSGNCVKDPNNALNTQCGTQGASCVDCSTSSQICDKTTFACVGSSPVGGGTGGGNNCGGCLLPNGTCNPPQQSATSVVNCGLGGVTCKACQTGEVCNNGTCEMPGNTGTIGSACTQDDECDQVPVSTDEQNRLGIKAYCKTNMLDLEAQGGQGSAYPGGYCTKRCGFINGACGTGSECLISLGFLGEYENVCFKACTQNTDCRDGYLCAQFSATLKVCLPKVTTEDGGIYMVDAGPPRTEAAGSACTTDSQCQPPRQGTCITELESDGGLSGFTGGMCTAQCGAVAGLKDGDAWCGVNGACNAYGVNVPDGLGPIAVWQCEQACATDGGSPSCRTGYACNSGNCVRNCTAPGAGCTPPRTCDVVSGLCK